MKLGDSFYLQTAGLWLPFKCNHDERLQKISDNLLLLKLPFLLKGAHIITHAWKQKVNSLLQHHNFTIINKSLETTVNQKPLKQEANHTGATLAFIFLH